MVERIDVAATFAALIASLSLSLAAFVVVVVVLTTAAVAQFAYQTHRL